MKRAIGLLAITLAITILVSGCLDDVDGESIINKAISEEAVETWCIGGLTWDYTGADAAINWEIKEVVQFKNATYCKIEAVSETEILNATYYVNNNQRDIWYVIELPDGTTRETHVVSPAE